MEDLQHDHLTNMDLEIDNPVRQHLNEAAKWSKFISIVMFIASALILVFGVLGGTVMSAIFQKAGSSFDILGKFGGEILIVIVVFVALVVAVVYYFLYDFSLKIKTALISENTGSLNAGLKSLKLFFMITTIFAILSLLNEVIKLF